jgi:hypothetical protein
MVKTQNKTIIPNELFGLTQEQIVNFCLKSDFPGTEKWPANHPIWKAYLPGCPSPIDGWKNESIIRAAVKNMFWILQKDSETKHEPNFVRAHQNAFNNAVVVNGKIVKGDLLLHKVLVRFTVAKIAPKVTAFSESTFLKIINETNIDLSSGVYCPMAGFGGIVRGTQKWFTNRGKSFEGKIEAYDINEDFCNWYGWTQRNALAQTIETDKVVIACPPFGDKYEHWTDTNMTKSEQEKYDEMSSLDFHDWCKQLMEHIKAPNYIFVGPELDENSKKGRIGLFKRKSGVQWYPEYTNDTFKIPPSGKFHKFISE